MGEDVIIVTTPDLASPIRAVDHGRDSVSIDASDAKVSPRALDPADRLWSGALLTSFTSIWMISARDAAVFRRLRIRAEPCRMVRIWWRARGKGLTAFAYTATCHLWPFSWQVKSESLVTY